VIFDCDGVLFDSFHANIAYYNAVLAALGRPLLDGDGERMAHVLSTPQLLAALFGDDPAALARARTIAQELDYTPFYPLMAPAPGMTELLSQLKSRYRLAMATNRGMTVRGVVRHFGLDRFLELAVGIYDVPRPKPAPDMIAKCIAHFGIVPGEAVYVGDTESDYAAASGAGAHFIGIGEHTGAPTAVRQLAEVQGLLAAWPAR